MSKQFIGNLQMMLAAMIWGFTFVAQDIAMNYMGPFTFNALRSVIAGIALIPVVFFFTKRNKESKKNVDEKKKTSNSKQLLLGGILCGIILTAASAFQQIGISKGILVGKAGFITTLYIVFVPIFGIFLGHKVLKNIWFAVVLCLIGLYLLCINEQFSIKTADVYLLICGILFSFHILCIDYFSTKVSCIKLSLIQLWVTAVLSYIMSLIYESPDIGKVLSSCLWPILYSGIMSSGVAYTLQMLGQRNSPPAIASLLLSLEAVFSLIAGYIILGDNLNNREILGCCIMFLSILISQIPPETIKSRIKQLSFAKK